MVPAKKDTPTGPDLRAYRGKRRFDRTPEPAGGGEAASSTGRLLVVQKHDARQLHYDFRLELDGALKSWALPRGPSLDPKQKPLAVQVEDHPLEYGSFEGIIPDGEYGAGTVMLWDRGRWEPIGDPAEGIARGDFKFRLFGEKLRGDWALVRMKGKAGGGGKNWLLIKKTDGESRPVASYNVQAELPFSVASGRTMEQIAAAPEAVWKDGKAQPVQGAALAAKGAPGAAGPDPSALRGSKKGKLPAKLAPQLAGTASRAPEGDEWLHEVKLDGYRLLCRIEDGSAKLLTRNGHDWTDRFAAVAAAAARMPVASAFLDGEVVVLNDDGVPDFGALQAAMSGGAANFTYFVFDVPFAQGFDLRGAALLDRKKLLESLLSAAPMVAPTIRYCEHFVGNGPVVFEHAANLGLEGIISKKCASAYVSRRTDDWVKVRNTNRQELVVGGFTDSPGRPGFGALLVGFHDGEGRLTYCGRVGMGFDEKTIEALRGELDRRSRKSPAFRNPEADPEAKSAHWVRPELVVEVEFTGWTHDGLLRHPVYRGLRPDIHPGDVVREAPGAAPRAAPAAPIVAAPPSPDDAVVAGVRISHPKRSVYPEDRVTKQQVAEYYEAVADRILPFVAGRPLSLVRCPLGLAGESFFQRRLLEGFPKSVRGTGPDEQVEGEPYVLIDDLTGLVSLVQMGTLEIHTWGCREDDLEKPDHLVFDLDPGPEIEWEHVVASAFFVRKRLEDLGLTCFVKTTGGRGAHVVVPLHRRRGWDEAKAFARAVADDIVRIAPRNFVATMSKAFRTQRIFVDYLRNQRGSTAIAPYSTRARPGACVATPLAWDELSPETPPSRFTVKTVPARLEALSADPWEAYHTTRQSITVAMLRSLGARG